MDLDQVTERLLWLEARGLTLSAEARRLRRRAAAAKWIDEGDVVREMARISLELGSREDEARLWERTMRRRRVYQVRAAPVVPAPSAPWWRRWWPW